MELGTFGAVMKYAIELESTAARLYQDAQGYVTSGELKEKIENLLNACSKRVSILERIRRENITEMILEPIRDLDTDSYAIEKESIDWSNISDVPNMILLVESTRKKFFQDASLKIEFLIETADAFERLADENEEHMDLFK